MELYNYLLQLLVTSFCFFSQYPAVLGNTIPAFTTTTYPTTVTHNEGSGTPSGTTLHTFTATDADLVNPIMSYTYDPTAGSDMFTITESNPSTGQTEAVVKLATGKSFNYETTKTYKIYANAYDGVAYASSSVLLNIDVIDVGETPTLSPATTVQSFTIDENPTGTHIGHPSFSVVDVDEYETHTWSITGGTGTSYINIIPTNGSISLKADYDREGAGVPANVYVDVSITDKYTLSVTTTYSVVVEDINDNTPIFNPTLYSFALDQTSAIGTTVATLTVTDADVTSPNNAMTYSFDTSTTADYFEISGDDVKLLYTIDILYGTGPYVFYIYATDGGSPAYTGTATLSFTVPVATTAPTTTTLVPPAGYDSFTDSSTVILLIAACCVAAVILGYTLVLCWRWHTFGQCLPERCPTRQQFRTSCDRCCACCPGDDIENDAMYVDETVKKKGGTLGPEAPNSRHSEPIPKLGKYK